MEAKRSNSSENFLLSSQDDFENGYDAMPTSAESSSSSTPQNPITLPEDYQPRNHDICCGRGKRNWNHEGNVWFRNLIQANVDRYLDAPSKTDKTAVVISIVEQVRKEGAYFVKQDDNSGQWYDIGDAQAREKVGHSLRDQVTAQKKKDKDPPPLTGSSSMAGGVANSVTSSGENTRTTPAVPAPVASAALKREVSTSSRTATGTAVPPPPELVFSRSAASNVDMTGSHSRPPDFIISVPNSQILPSLQQQHSQGQQKQLDESESSFQNYQQLQLQQQLHQHLQQQQLQQQQLQQQQMQQQLSFGTQLLLEPQLPFEMQSTQMQQQMTFSMQTDQQPSMFGNLSQNLYDSQPFHTQQQQIGLTPYQQHLQQQQLQEQQLQHQNSSNLSAWSDDHDYFTDHIRQTRDDHVLNDHRQTRDSIVILEKFARRPSWRAMSISSTSTKQLADIAAVQSAFGHVGDDDEFGDDVFDDTDFDMDQQQPNVNRHRSSSILQPFSLSGAVPHDTRRMSAMSMGSALGDLDMAAIEATAALFPNQFRNSIRRSSVSWMREIQHQFYQYDLQHFAEGGPVDRRMSALDMLEALKDLDYHDDNLSRGL